MLNAWEPTHNTPRRPDYAQPVEVGHFSKFKDKSLHLDNRQMSYLRLAQPGFNLLSGYDTFEPPADSYGLESLQEWVVERSKVEKWEEKTPLIHVFHGAGFVSYRGIYTKIGLCPYENREPLLLVLVKYKGIIFMAEFPTEKKLEDKGNEPLVQKKAVYAGYNFETFVTTEDRDGKRYCSDNGPCEPKNQYCVALRAKLNGTRIFMVAEIDCADPRTNEYVELKTQRVLEPGSRQESNFKRFKCRRVWLQSYLAGTKTVIFGLRDDNFTIRDYFTLGTLEFPRYCRSGVPQNLTWDPNTCLSFIDTFLSFTRDSLRHTSDLSYHKVYFDHRTGQMQFEPTNDPTHFFLKESFLRETNMLT